MLKASALYIVIIITLVIGVICSALIIAAYFYKSQYDIKARYDTLSNNTTSGINLLIGSPLALYPKMETVSLFGRDDDSVCLKQMDWGIYDIGVVEAFMQKDTLFKTFSTAYTIDSTKWAAVYLGDEDRPFSISGKTVIRGNAFIPRAGIQEAYINSKAYQGNKSLIFGKKFNSEKKIPALSEIKLRYLEKYLDDKIVSEPASLNSDSIKVSFRKDTRIINFGKEVKTVKNEYIDGNVILLSDTTIIIDGSTKLKNVVVFAKAVIIKSGFNGNCQLFATDSIHTEKDCRFGYPSCLGTIHFKHADKAKFQSRITVEDNTVISGIIFTYEKDEKAQEPFIFIGRNAGIIGQIYSSGILEMKDNVKIYGSVVTRRFLYKNPTTQFDNYLMNAIIDSKALSPYYLTSGLMPFEGRKKKILQWLETN